MRNPSPGVRQRPIEFWSSVGPHGFQAALLAEIERAGWPVAERSSISMEQYRSARGLAARVLLRARAFGSYPIGMRLRMARSERDAIAVVSNSPFFAPTLATLANRRPVVNWLLDLYPYALVVAGKLKPGGLVYRALHATVAAGLRRAACNVFLGEKLKRSAEQDFGQIPRAVIIPVGADGAPFRAHPPRAGKAARGAVKIIYCGNLGHMHDVSTVGTLLEGGLPSTVAMSFYGNGIGFTTLTATCRNAPVAGKVVFAGNLEHRAWVEEMLAAEVALVTMKPGSERVVMPSKTYSALMAGQAVLAICPRDSDLANLILAHDAGWVVAPGDVAGLRSVIERLSKDPDELQRKRLNAWQAGHAHYDQPVIARQWIEVFERVKSPIGADHV